MKIEIRVGSYSNKGDALMLQAIIDKLGSSFDLVTIPRIADYKIRASLNLYQKIHLGRFENIIANKFNYFIPGKIRKYYGLVLEKEISAVLDASGFAYGDQWGTYKLEQLAKAVRRWKKQEKKIILLPQSFGPFTSPLSKKLIGYVIKNSDLIYTRDKKSLEYLLELNDDSEKIIKYCPDFTIGLKGIKKNLKISPRSVAVILNHRMIDNTDIKIAQNYLPFLKKCIEILLEKELEPFILLHDDIEEEIAKQLRESLSYPVKIITDNNPRILKGIIGCCRMVVSSRFHGLINALSQNIPVLATGWSHKFEMLFDSYGCTEYLVSPLISDRDLNKKINNLLNVNTRKDLINNINLTNKKNSVLVQKMWKEVKEKLIKNSLKNVH